MQQHVVRIRIVVPIAWWSVDNERPADRTIIGMSLAPNVLYRASDEIASARTVRFRSIIDRETDQLEDLERDRRDARGGGGDPGLLDQREDRRLPEGGVGCVG